MDSITDNASPRGDIARMPYAAPQLVRLGASAAEGKAYAVTSESTVPFFPYTFGNATS